MATTARYVDTADLEQRVKSMDSDVALKPDLEFHLKTGRPLVKA